MDKRTISQRLALAESRVSGGEARVSKQRILVKRLELLGLDALPARKLLRELEEVQNFFIVNRDQLKSEMALSAAARPVVIELQSTQRSVDIAVIPQRVSARH